MQISQMISVIIPVFNAEKCLPCCMESILQQDDDNYEIILVNDGSTDDSYALIEQYCNSYPFIHCINKGNGGVSSARNTGLDCAKGEFILFIDADDSVKEGYFHYLRKLQQETQADIVTSQVCSISQQDTVTSDQEIKLVQNQEYLDFEKRLFDGSVCGKLYCRAVIKDVRFRLGIYYEEDSLFVCQAVINAQKIAISQNCYYQYVLNMESATHHYSKQKLYTRFQARKEIMRLLSDMPGSIADNARIEMAVCATKILLLTASEYSKNDEHDRILRQTVKAHIIALLKSYVSGRIKIASLLVALSPVWAARIMHMMENLRKKSFRENIAQLGA